MTARVSANRLPAVRAAPGESRRGYILVLAATVCWSTSGTFIRLILNRYPLPAWTLAFWRDFFAFVILLAITLVFRSSRLRVPLRDLLPLALMGATSIGVFHVLWVRAVMMIPVAVATVLNYTAPAFVVLFAWLLWREKPNRRQAFALGAAFLGCVLVTGAYDVSILQSNWLGLLIGLSTGVTYASFTIISKHALRRTDSWAVLTYAFGFASLTLAVLRPSAPVQMLGLPAGAWARMAGLAFVTTVGGFAFYTAGLKHLPAASASIVATLEPAIATGLAFVLLGEAVGPIQLFGGALVITAVVLLVAKKEDQGRTEGE